jgi:hypothetical protein
MPKKYVLSEVLEYIAGIEQYIADLERQLAAEQNIEPLQNLCASLGCPPGIDRFKFLAYKIKTLQKQADGLCDSCSQPLEDAYCTTCSGRNDLDWEPSVTRTVSDMANVGNAFIEAVNSLMPNANWNTCPVELFRGLYEKLTEAQATIETLNVQKGNKL